MTESCATCRFRDDSRCRRYPPPETGVDHDGFSTWPVVRATDWCGEYRRRPSEQTFGHGRPAGGPGPIARVRADA